MDFVVLKSQIYAVNKAFYERIYKDPWLMKVFRGVAQDHITQQQTDFMLGAYGGPKNYAGRAPQDAHPHIYIDEEMWQLREKYLMEAFIETGFPEELRTRWLRIDEAFKRAILKKGLGDCQKRFFTDEIIYEPNPAKKYAA